MKLTLELEIVTAFLALVALLRLLPDTARAFIAEWREASWGIRAAVFSAVLLGAVMRFWLAEPGILYTLPDAYFSADRHFFPLGSHSTWHPMHGMGSAVLASIAGAVFGPSFKVLSVISAVAGLLVIPMVFLFGGRLVGSRLAGALASWVLAVHVPTIRVDVSDQTVSLSALAFLLAGHWVLTALREGSRKNFIFAAFAVGAAAQFRLEYLLHLAALALLVILSARLLKGHGRHVLAGLGVLLLLVVPRAINTLIESFTVGATVGGTWRLDVFWELFASGSNLWLNPRFTTPLLVVFVVLGLWWLVLERRFSVALFFVTSIAGPAMFCFNEWMLDFNDVLRFQTNLFAPFAILSGVGLAGLIRRLDSQWVVRPSIALSFVLPVVWLVPGLSLLQERQANDHEVDFMTTHGRSISRACPILVQGVSSPELRSYRTGWRPGWLVGRSEPLPRFPDELPQSLEGSCPVAFIGVDCFRWYGDEILDVRREADDRPPLRDVLSLLHDSLDENPPPVMRSECAELFDQYDMEPIATRVVSLRRRGAAWEPLLDVEIGLYRLNATESEKQRVQGDVGEDGAKVTEKGLESSDSD